MNKIKLDRRSFVKLTSIAGGGLAIGFTLLTSCKEEVKQMILPELEMPKTWNNIGGYIKIGDNGIVTIMSPNPEIGQNVKTSMPMIIAEELEVDWDKVIVEQAPLDTELYQRQVAGGSQSIRFGWDSLRTAGAAVKTMLICAAADRWDVDPSECMASNGEIRNQAGAVLTYGELASDAALLPVPEEVELKSTKDYKIIGYSKGNVDMDNILTGKPLFGIDTKVEGMKYASVLRPPAFGQKLSFFDECDALKVNGVIDVFRFAEKIAVIANSNWAAIKGKRALKAEWEKDTKSEDSKYHDYELNCILDGYADIVREDCYVDEAFEVADQVVERVYEAPFLPHNCLEPMNFFAHVMDDSVVLRGPIQTPERTRKQVADLLERDIEDIQMEMTRMGGGFGRRLYGNFAEEAAEISNISKLPIQLLYTREDDMTAGTYRPASKYKIKAAIKDNKITAYELTEACVNNNMYGLIPNFFPANAIANYRVKNGNLESNITTGAWRAPYTNFLGFAEQSFFDEMAEIMNINPVKLRLDLYEAAKNNPDERMQWDPDRMKGVLELVVDKSGYGNPQDDVYQGLSVYYSHNTHVAEVAEVVIQEGQPIVQKVYCAVDCGIVINPESARNQIEGGIVDGIGHAMYGELSFKNGIPQATNFHNYRLIRAKEAPKIEVFFVENQLSPTGLGEPSLPPAGGALANALYKATGKRIYKQPFINQVDVLG